VAMAGGDARSSAQERAMGRKDGGMGVSA